jgi:hypothetical protein
VANDKLSFTHQATAVDKVARASTPASPAGVPPDDDPGGGTPPKPADEDVCATFCHWPCPSGAPCSPNPRLRTGAKFAGEHTRPRVSRSAPSPTAYYFSFTLYRSLFGGDDSLGEDQGTL